MLYSFTCKHAMDRKGKVEWVSRCGSGQNLERLSFGALFCKHIDRCTAVILRTAPFLRICQLLDLVERLEETKLSTTNIPENRTPKIHNSLAHYSTSKIVLTACSGDFWSFSFSLINLKCCVHLHSGLELLARRQ